jgi:hypothetical protein
MQDRDTIILSALNLWGEELQLNMLQEECAELIAAVNHFRRERCGPEEVVKELVDVQVMVLQAIKIFSSSDEFSQLLDASLENLGETVKRIYNLEFEKNV